MRTQVFGTLFELVCGFVFTAFMLSPLPALAQPSGEDVANFEEGCNGGNLDDCFSLGDAFWQANGVPRDETQAVTIWRRACNAGHSASCGSFAFALHLGAGVQQNKTTAFRLATQACDDGEACRLLAYIELDNQTRPYADSRDIAKQLYKKACEQGDGEGCWEHGKLFSSPQTVETSEQAAMWFDRACTLSFMKGCAFLAGIHERGELGSADKPAAHDLYVQACEGGNTFSCADAARTHADPGGVAAVKLLQTGCDRGGKRSCAAAGKIYEAGSSGIERDLTRAKAFYERGCERRHTPSCEKAAQIVVPPTQSKPTSTTASVPKAPATANASTSLTGAYLHNKNLGRKDFAKLYMRVVPDGAGFKGVGVRVQVGNGRPEYEVLGNGQTLVAWSGTPVATCVDFLKNTNVIHEARVLDIASGTLMDGYIVGRPGGMMITMPGLDAPPLQANGKCDSRAEKAGYAYQFKSTSTAPQQRDYDYR